MPETSDENHSGEHRRHRRRRRHKNEKPGSKVALIAVAALLLIAAAAVVIALGPRLRQKLTAPSASSSAATRNFVTFGRQTIIINNLTDTNWAYTTITVNDQYVAHCPEVPKGTQFEIWFKNLKGTNGVFDPVAERIQSVKIEPEGQSAIAWTPPVE